ncbi:7-cyano-7-deazaguanine synthase QueC [Dactylosporangium darangshiense]|uniref:7-cyano-7-deazaguanine synthase n=1 Tax=Dactylosporangium darangshiense TaxID=579108 RepID=A0ABP8DIF9_9ACTN
MPVTADGPQSGPGGEILLYSAGLDSFPAWHYLGRPRALYLDIGHHFRAQELASVRTLAVRCGIDLTVSDELDLSAWDTPQGDLIPARNLLLATLGALRADTIWCVGVKGDHAPDKSPEAFERMSVTLSELTQRPVRVDSPFWAWTKTEVVRWYVDAGLPVDDLLQTFSCLLPGDGFEHCGVCASCLRRWIALVNNGIEGRFAAPPWEWDLVHTYYMRAMRDGTYPEHRAEEFAAAMRTVGVTV